MTDNERRKQVLRRTLYSSVDERLQAIRNVERFRKREMENPEQRHKWCLRDRFLHGAPGFIKWGFMLTFLASLAALFFIVAGCGPPKLSAEEIAAQWVQDEVDQIGEQASFVLTVGHPIVKFLGKEVLAELIEDQIHKGATWSYEEVLLVAPLVKAYDSTVRGSTTSIVPVRATAHLDFDLPFEAGKLKSEMSWLLSISLDRQEVINSTREEDSAQVEYTEIPENLQEVIDAYGEAKEKAQEAKDTAEEAIDAVRDTGLIEDAKEIGDILREGW